MKLELKRHHMVERYDRTDATHQAGDPKLINDEPIQSDKSLVMLVDVETKILPPCEASYCDEFSICPCGKRGYRLVAQINITNHTLTIIDTSVRSAEAELIIGEASKIVMAEYGWQFERVNNVIPLIDKLRIVADAEAAADSPIVGPDGEPLYEDQD